MDGITWRKIPIRGKNAHGDISLSLTKHKDRKDQLRVAIYANFIKTHNCNYLAISEFLGDSDRIYFLITESRKIIEQNKITDNTYTKQALFTLKDGEEEIIKKWCGSYKLTPFDKDVYYIEREVNR